MSVILLPKRANSFSIDLKLQGIKTLPLMVLSDGSPSILK